MSNSSKLTIPNAVLKPVIKALSSTVSQTNPVLSNVLIECNENTLLMETSNGESTQIFSVELPYPSEFKAAANVQRLSTLLSNIDDNVDIEMVVAPNYFVNVKANKSKYSVGGIPHLNFPSSSKNPSRSELTVFSVAVNAKDLLHVIKRCMFCANDNGDEGSSLAGVQFLFTKYGLEVNATDRKRVANLAIPDTTFKELTGKGFVIHKKSLAPLLGRLSEAGSDALVKIICSTNRTFFKFPHMEMSLGVLASRFPDISRIFVGCDQGKIKIPTKELLKALTRLTAVADEKTLFAKFKLANGSLIIKSTNIDTSQGIESMEVDTDESFDTGFNIRDVIEFVKVADGDFIGISYKDDKSMYMLYEIDSPYNYRYIIMPIVVHLKVDEDDSSKVSSS